MTTTTDPASGTTAAPGARLGAIFTDVHTALLDVIVRHRVTWEEFRAAIAWLTEAGTQPHEIPLMLEVFLSPTVDDLAHAGEPGTACNIEGPFYVADAPLLERPYVLPRRTGEPGERLVFSGVVRAVDGAPLAGAVLDLWQANGVGEYSHFSPGVPDGNLRGRLTTDDTGHFEVDTVVPAAYPIPLAGATGRLLTGLGRDGFRPAHLHVKITHPDAAPLTTQIYFGHDPRIGSDIVDAVKPSLIADLTRHDDGAGGSYAGCGFDFVLDRRKLLSVISQ